MSYNSENSVFATIEDYYASTQRSKAKPKTRIVHCINPFAAKPGTEHYRAQRVTFASMTRARQVAQILRPQVEIVFAKVTLEEDKPTSLIAFDISAELDKTVLDLKDFQTPRPLPLLMDILMAIDLEPQDIFVFTNVDIALTPNFYAFINALFERGTDCAIINRRTISNVYRDENDLSLMASEVGVPHPGFDCFAFLGSLRKDIIRYESCIGIAGVMLPLVHQLLATARQPVVLLDAHATYHLGNDRQWKNDEFDDYAKHNRSEVDNVFNALIEDTGKKERLLARLSGEHGTKIFPRRLWGLVGKDQKARPPKKMKFIKGLRSKVREVFHR